MEYRSHKKDYWNILHYVGKEKYVLFLKGTKISGARNLTVGHQIIFIDKGEIFYAQKR